MGNGGVGGHTAEFDGAEPRLQRTQLAVAGAALLQQQPKQAGER